MTGEELERRSYDKEVYFDNPLSYDWEKLELLDTIDCYDSEWKIYCYHDGMSLEAVGKYSIGELVEVLDIEVIG